MHLLTMIAVAGAGWAGWYGYKRWKASKLVGESGSATGGMIAGRNPGTGTGESSDINAAAHGDLGDGNPTNVYDAVIGVANIVGGTVSTALSNSTGDVEDTTEDVVDRMATARAEVL